MSGFLSMTGFGRFEAQSGDFHAAAEIRAINNRFLEVSTKISRSLCDFEFRAKEIIREYLKRGRIYLILNDLSPSTRMGEVRLDEELSSGLLEHLRELSSKLNLKGEVTLQHLLPFIEEIHEDGIVSVPPELFIVAEQALIGALEKVGEMRTLEGAALKKDFLKRLNTIEEGIKRAGELAQDNTAVRLEKIKERIEALMGYQELDPQRLETEAVFLADKSDITEELVRMKSHHSQFKKIVMSGGPCGRRLNFLIQEMNRELNTASAKAGITELSHLVVEMKEELEKMREQAQNVE